MNLKRNITTVLGDAAIVIEARSDGHPELIDELAAWRKLINDRLEYFDRVIKPMRDKADAGQCEYDEYDEAYATFLGELHDLLVGVKPGEVAS